MTKIQASKRFDKAKVNFWASFLRLFRSLFAALSVQNRVADAPGGLPRAFARHSLFLFSTSQLRILFRAVIPGTSESVVEVAFAKLRIRALKVHAVVSLDKVCYIAFLRVCVTLHPAFCEDVKETASAFDGPSQGKNSEESP